MRLNTAKAPLFSGKKKLFLCGIQALIQVGDGEAYSNHFLYENI